MTVTVIAPHPDDESIGCGGVLCKHSARGDRVVVVYLTSGELGLKSLPKKTAWKTREREAQRAAKVLGVAATVFLRAPDWAVAEDAKNLSEQLGALFRQERPQMIYLPHPAEWHPDHKACWPILSGVLASGLLPDVTVRAYEVWTPLTEFDHVEDITAEMQRKMRAVRCHRSQLHEFAYDRAVRGLNQFRGIMSGRCRYAEVFQSLAEKGSS